LQSIRLLQPLPQIPTVPPSLVLWWVSLSNLLQSVVVIVGVTTRLMPVAFSWNVSVPSATLRERFAFASMTAWDSSSTGELEYLHMINHRNPRTILFRSSATYCESYILATIRSHRVSLSRRTCLAQLDRLPVL
jgi:hypothetical protein